jgi:glycosyltransferase involved in cell wall biosynthesis
MPSIAFTLIGHNEAHNLPRALESVRWADQLVYVDCASKDNSLVVASRYTERVFGRPNLTNLNINKQYAIDQATTDWVFYLDPDEVISPELAQEIRRVIASAPAQNAFKLPRRNYYFGRWLRHGGQYPDTQLRLFRRNMAYFPRKHVHERLEVKGAIGRLALPMDHYTCDTPFIGIGKLDFYTSFNAEVMARSGRRAGPWTAVQFIVLMPLQRFVRRYVLKGGFLDGLPGLFACMLDSMDFPIRYFKFWYWTRHPEALPPAAQASSLAMPEAGETLGQPHRGRT